MNSETQSHFLELSFGLLVPARAEQESGFADSSFGSEILEETGLRDQLERFLNSPQTMTAAVRENAALALRDDLPLPSPRRDELLVQVAACRLDRWDLAAKRPPALIPGSGFAGRVVGVGEDVPAWRLGDRVVVDPGFSRSGQYLADLGFERDGGLAQFAIAPAWAAIAIGCDTADAALAQLPTYYGRAERALIWGRLYADETVLVLGANEGSGPAAIELAKSRGATVIASAPEWSRAELETRGATFVAGAGVARRVELIVDFRAIPDPLSHCEWLSPTGVYVSVGGVIARTGSRLVQATSNPDIFTLRYLENLTHALSERALTIGVSRTFGFGELAAAVEAAEDPHQMNPIVVVSGQT
ncbi:MULTISPECIES: alcohol dehydrogenase catalytic domain-containing protein [unclassified Bradyrhizobium]|uniref:alcohol dehydrogenase catalytic domain-containing protein n=1 Tax=unclassified Bradyrhizobium TaxID=2631580 RepID=UPI001FF789C5|nr:MULTISPECIES: alcohol dehydrogenase catalytic domain-containing protein [unclassified Bradyrhizobium]MCK1710436.1 alcohol dehydrogenase catalytic domain-containing protein [Bradyrhizobium sp. 143]MCK1728267.1 alcohol dehydrogenase catalytic domain-containing protein [Bradyrhizobium sp. 142]